MLKLVFIGLLIAAAATLCCICTVKLVKLKNLRYRQAQQEFEKIRDYKSSNDILDEIAAKLKSNRFVASIVVFLAVFVSISYFFIARDSFAKHHDHDYRPQVTREATCVLEGVRTYTCRFCDDSYTESIPMIEHDYAEVSRNEATCIAEGEVVFACSACGDQITEALPKIDHKYTVTEQKEPTCVAVGSVTYTCGMCGDTYTEALEMTDHSYVETDRAEANCSAEGHIDYTCEICGDSYSEPIGINGEHSYHLYSYTKSRNRFVCEYCGDRYFSYKTDYFNWVFWIVAILLVICIIIFIYVWQDSGSWYWRKKSPWFWISSILGVISLIVMLCHTVVYLLQDNGKHFYDDWLTDAPNSECVYEETEHTDATYTKLGSVTFTCAQCGDSFKETIPKIALPEDWSAVPDYKEPQKKEISEKELNGKPDIANTVTAYSTVTANLVSSNDLDMFKFKLDVPGKITFDFSHEADEIYAYWNVTVSDSDGNVFIDGYIPSMKKGQIKSFTIENAAIGTYYIKVSPASGGNPLMFGFSAANYHIGISAECLEHSHEALYVSKRPTGTDKGEYAVVCKDCGFILETGEINATGESSPATSSSEETPTTASAPKK